MKLFDRYDEWAYALPGPLSFVMVIVAPLLALAIPAFVLVTAIFAIWS